MFLYLCSFFLRTIRWVFLISKEYNVPFEDLFKVNILGYAANNLLPLRLGEIVRAQILYKSFSIPRSFSIGSIFIERFFDLISIIFYLFVGYFINFGNFNLILRFTNIYVLILICILLLIFIFYKFKIFIKINFLIKDFKFYYHIKNFFKSFKHLTPFMFFKVFGLSILIWLVEIFVLQALLLLLNKSNSFTISLFTVPILNLGLLIPSAPGYLGVFQSGFVFAFEILGIDKALGLSVSIIFHFIQYMPVTLLGIYYFHKNKINLITFLSKNINESKN